MKYGQRGLSLIELLVAISIAGIAGFLLIQILLQNSGLFYSQTAEINQGLNLNDDVAIIGNDLKNTSGIVVGYPISSPVYISGAHVLVMGLPAIDSNGDVINGVTDYLVISADNSTPQILREQVFPDPQSSRKSSNRVLSTNLQQITFTYLDSNANTVDPSSAAKVSFAVELSNKLGLNNQQSSSSATIYLRNE